ncbi:unnamed protein product [Pedinophyceae sp. YPF-701]|nr:unnamed protein product [Pedinophyceae sp. YPF-701]
MRASTRFTRVQDLPEPETPAWLPRIAQHTVTQELSMTVGLPRQKDLPSPRRRTKRPATTALFDAATLTAPQAYELPIVKERRLKAAQHAEAQQAARQQAAGAQAAANGKAKPGSPGSTASPRKTHGAASPPATGERLPALRGRAGASGEVDAGKTPSLLQGRHQAMMRSMRSIRNLEAGISSFTGGARLGTAEHLPGENLDDVAEEDAERRPHHKEMDLETIVANFDGSTVPGIETGDDVLEFYARFGQDAPIKFFYCIKADTGLDFRPYDLEVVRREDVGNQYYTISATGVMKIRRGVQSEFISLAEWIREKTLFSLLRNIPFFKHYIVGNFFRAWRQTVRRKLFNRVRQKLSAKLFLAQPTFLPSLVEVQGHVSALREVAITASPTHTCELHSYLELQVTQRETKAKTAVESVVDRVQGVLERLCKEVQKQAKLYQESIRDISELEDTTGVDLYVKAGEKKKSMAAIRQEKVDRAATYRRVMEEAARLGDFIRLVDYMLVEAVVDQSVSAVDDVRALLESPRQQAQDKLPRGVFLTVLDFGVDESSMEFFPPERAVSGVIDSVVEGIITLAQAAPRVLFMRSFGQFFDGKLQGLNPVHIITHASQYLEARDRISEVIRSDYQQAADYAQIFTQYRKIHEFGRAWDPAQYDMSNATLESLRADIFKQMEWKLALERMKIGHVEGMLQIDSKTLRNRMIPVTQKTLDDLKMMLVSKARDLCSKTSGLMESYIQSLSQRPQDLDMFVLYQVMHREIVEKKAEVLEQFAEVEAMYHFLERELDQRVAFQDASKFETLSQELRPDFERQLDDGREFVLEHAQGMISNLDQDIRSINNEAMELLGNLHSGPSMDPDSDPAGMVEELEQLQEHMQGMRKRAAQLQEYQRLFDVPTDDMSNLSLMEREVQARSTIWNTLAQFEQSKLDWLNGPVLELDVEQIVPQVDNFGTTGYKLGKQLKDDRVVFRLREAVDEFRELLPLVEQLANPALKVRHWEAVFAMVGEPGFDVQGEPFAINDLLQLGVRNKMDKVQEISATASKEYSLEKALDKMAADWEGLDFIVVPYKDTGTYILGGVDEIQMILDDQIVKIQSMRASPFIKPFADRCAMWDDTLNTLQSIIDNQLACQATWQYLEPIFSSPDIMKQMPTEGEKFQQVDQTWRELMEQMLKSPGCLVVARDKTRLAQLKEANELLDDIQKGLAAYLELKRIAFPRFFFLSNDEMLEILSETKDPLRVQPHLNKCFEGIHRLDFQPNTDVHGMMSVEGEKVPFRTHVKPKEANGAVEKWLLQVEHSMLEAVKHVTGQSIEAYATTPRKEWVLQWPGQIVLVVTAVDWTAGVEAVFEEGRKGALQEYTDKCTAQLGDIVELVRGDLSKLDRATLSALVVMDVHARDVTAELARQGLEAEENPFAWQSQLRTYWEAINEGEDLTVVCKMMNAHVEYGYEYLGNSSRLVITPLTDRCYRTLMGAVHLNLGGAPEGPAGTGKTETTKDLAKALARQCVVFNCSDQIGYLQMAKMFKGLASSGAWACFDEFNRIDLEVLSVVAQQVLEIQLAVKHKVKTFVFEGSEIPLKPTCNVFITMNPGYAGRSELPDNLKALFRTVAMMVPDYAMIAEIILYSYGYLQARDSARKIVATYKLCSEQLSSQFHYDYGMRAVVAVLRAAGNLKRQHPNEDEFVLMLRSIIDVNLCKFLSQDVPLFNGIVSDLFPGVKLPAPDYDNLRGAIQDQCKKRNLQCVPYFELKTIQLYEMVVVRHGLMIVGLPFSGKSSCLHVLAGALGQLKAAGKTGPLFEQVRMEVVNPKSVTMGQLYGETDRATQEWKDGNLAGAFRKLANPADTSTDRKWCVLDGPVDAIWIENMNTVLDDNKKLCLPNSEIIAMHPNMSMIFEVGDLRAASPATVSRCGMVYLEPSELGWPPLLKSWLNTLPAANLGADIVERIGKLYDWLMLPCLRFSEHIATEISPTAPSAVANSAMRLTKALLDEFQTPAQDESLDGDAAAAEPPQAAPGAAFDDRKKARWVDAIVMFSLVWSAGCTGDAESRLKFDKFFRELLSGLQPEEVRDFMTDCHPVDLVMEPFPATGTVFEFLFDKTNGAWKAWADTLPEVNIPENAQFSDIIVPTIDSARYTFLLDLAIQHQQPMLLVGPTGTGKSVYIRRHLVSGLPKGAWVQIFVTMSARTTANMTQDQIDGRLDKRRKGIYGPPIGQRAIVFIDDMNMPAKEQYGAQPPIELLRQFMDYSGWYAREGKGWMFRHMDDVQLVGAMGPPGGGRSFITDRFLRHFNTVAVTQVEDTTLLKIFNTILGWHFSAQGFPEEIKVLGPKIVSATLQIYDACLQSLLPTPLKSHYTFNLRDFARVVQGVMLLPILSLPDDEEGKPPQGPGVYCRLFVHEVFRVFYDRLVDKEDREWLVDTAGSAITTHLETSLEALFPHLVPEGEGAKIGTEQMRSVMFGDFLDTEADDPALRQYAEVTDTGRAISAMEDFLRDYNGMSKRPMNLAMFLFAVEHVSRICRLLKQPGGNMLLVGVGGSGRQSLTRLAAFMCGMEVFQVEISKNYSKSDWHEDLKAILRKAGGEGKPSVFLFSDTQIKDESFVEDLNNILNSGEVPNMFPQDERMTVMEQVRPMASKRGLETPLELWGYFVKECSNNLHIMFCMSPIGNAFRERLRQNPSLINCCTIDWFTAWPSDALQAVAQQFLKDVDLQPEQRESIVGICQHFHLSMQDASLRFREELGRYNYVTPTSYLELLSMTKSLLAKKRSENLEQQKRYLVGLEKLKSSQEQVAQMQEELRALQPQLVKTVGEVEQLIKEIAQNKTEVVEPKAAVVKTEEAAAQIKADEAKALKDQCEEELGKAMPILNDALSALDTIKEADINYVKKLTNPPGVIKLVMEAVCVILEVKPQRVNKDGAMVNDYWKPSLQLLNQKDFLQTLKEYDKDNIPPKIISKIRSEYTNREDFTPANAKNASSAAEGMCKWVVAMDKYDVVAKQVAPLSAAQEKAQSEYDVVMEGLRGKQAELKSLMDKLAEMEAELKSSSEKKDRLEAEVELCTLKLERAEKLIGGLGGEQMRWTEAAETLRSAHDKLTGDMLVSAGVISYLGAFTAHFRGDIVKSWAALLAEEKIPHSDNFNMAAVLGDPVKVREWLIAGLPNDGFSIDNGIVVANARRWPLMIDPQGQANKWIKNMCRSANLQVIKLDGGAYMRTLENAIQFGLPVLLENVGEELDPSLEPLLLKQVFKNGGVDSIKLGDSVIEYSPDFQFFITTKMRNPHYLPEIAVKVTLLNFMITLAGLSDQMLGVVVAKERPDLEEQHSQLVVQSAENKRRLKEIEDQILQVLSSSEGNILEDETAIQVITDAKVLGKEIEEKQKIAEVTEKEIETARENYAPCGDYVSLLFFCISDLANIDPMYQYSLPWYINLFVASIQAANAADDVPQRLANIHDHFTYSLYCNVCRSLFEKDKLLFAFLLCARIEESRGNIDSDEWIFLLTGGVTQPKEVNNPASDWLVDRGWREICKLGMLPAFDGIVASFLADPGEWKKLYDSPEPQKETFPGVWNDVSAFRRLMITRCIRLDKVSSAVQDFVANNLGTRFVEPPAFNLHACYNDSSPVTPLIFVLSAGSDPTAALLQFAGEKGMDSRLFSISLGQGQGPKAEVMMKQGMQDGSWVTLYNAHLAPSWMPSLDRICEQMDITKVHPDFRLWITSYPSPKFPVSILQNGVKMTNEPPKGIRANMRRTLHLEPMCNEEFFEGSSKPEVFKRLLFGLTFFHAVVQERRKFGPLGWNIQYGFDDGDLRISAQQLRMFLDENKKIPYEALLYATGECNYGGRVTDDKDRLLLNTILSKCYSTHVAEEDKAPLSQSGTYFVPEPGTLQDMLAYIDSLPITPMPEVFGLHDNADITKDQNDSLRIFESMLAMSGGGGGGGGAAAAAVEERVGVVVRDCMAALPPQFDIERVQLKYPVLYEESMNTVLAQEMLRFNRLTANIKESLHAIDLAIQGLQVMSAELEAAYNSISLNQVPELWKKDSYPTLKPLGSYLTDLYARLKMLQDWYEHGQPPIFWMSGFFFVQSFLTAALQNYARRHTIPIDEVGYDYQMLGMDPEDYVEPPEAGVYVHGMFLEGCDWDSEEQTLCESKPKVLFVPAPCIWMVPKKTADFSEYPHYNCPLYRTTERKGTLATTGHSTNFVSFIRLPLNAREEPAKYIMLGVAMVLALSD